MALRSSSSGSTTTDRTLASATTSSRIVGPQRESRPPANPREWREPFADRHVRRRPRPGVSCRGAPYRILRAAWPHLPLIADTAIACVIGKEIADVYQVHLLLPITMSCSHEPASFPSTVSISTKTLYAVIDDIRRPSRGLAPRSS
ncbi:creatininase family protein [Streptomyces sp. NPDC059558]|uniref:creatininase family protein n=1 Tax=Streptomyces sp. NPDC059558 TaxID=3346864 RepID=UPI0036B98863